MIANQKGDGVHSQVTTDISPDVALESRFPPLEHSWLSGGVSAHRITPLTAQVPFPPAARSLGPSHLARQASPHSPHSEHQDHAFLTHLSLFARIPIPQGFACTKNTSTKPTSPTADTVPRPVEYLALSCFKLHSFCVPLCFAFR